MAGALYQLFVNTLCKIQSFNMNWDFSCHRSTMLSVVEATTLQLHTLLSYCLLSIEYVVIPTQQMDVVDDSDDIHVLEVRNRDILMDDIEIDELAVETPTESQFIREIMDSDNQKAVSGTSATTSTTTSTQYGDHPHSSGSAPQVGALTDLRVMVSTV